MLCSFVLFPQLPVELQNMIWQFTLSDPRAISGEDCFREWWHRRLSHFLLPVALHVCHGSRSLAKKCLNRTEICIPGLPGWRTLYINPTHDFLYITKLNVQMNFQMSRLIANPMLINRLVITGIAIDTAWLRKDTMQFFEQFANLEELVLTDRGLLYRIQKRDFPTVDCSILSECMSKLVQRVQKFFKDEGKDVVVSGYWFDRN